MPYDTEHREPNSFSAPARAVLWVSMAICWICFELTGLIRKPREVAPKRSKARTDPQPGSPI